VGLDHVRAHVVVGTVLVHVVLALACVGVAPLGPLCHGQRNAAVGHGVEQVHEGHAQEHGVLQVGPENHAGPHQEPAGRTALAHQLAFLGQAGLLQPLRHVVEVVERVHFVLHFAVLLPAVSHVGRPAHVGGNTHYPPVEQTDILDIQVDRSGRTLGTLPLQPHLIRSVQIGDLLVPHNGHRHLGALHAVDELSLHCLLVAALIGHLLLFQESRVPA